MRQMALVSVGGSELGLASCTFGVGSRYKFGLSQFYFGVNDWIKLFGHKTGKLKLQLRYLPIDIAHVLMMVVGMNFPCRGTSICWYQSSSMGIGW